MCKPFHRLSVVFAVVAVLLSGCATTSTKRLGLAPLKTVSYVDLQRYLGTWYEIARFPHDFQEGCVATTATYTLDEDGELDVLNRCRLETLDGEEETAEGWGRIVNAKTNAELEVTFFWPFWGDYWIIDLDQNYQNAAVGHPSRDYLWILSRTPQMDDETYDAIVARLRKQGYEVERLTRTPQLGD